MEKKDIRAYTYEQLQEEMKGIGEKAFRGKQIYEWLHVRLADSFDEMTNLSKALREKLGAVCNLSRGIGSQTGVETGRDEQIPVPSPGRKYGGKCADAL